MRLHAGWIFHGEARWPADADADASDGLAVRDVAPDEHTSRIFRPRPSIPDLDGAPHACLDARLKSRQIDGLTLDRQNLIAGFQPRVGRRATRLHRAQHRRYGRLPELESEPPEHLLQLRQPPPLFGAADVQRRIARIAVLAAQRQHDIGTAAHRIEQAKDDIPLLALGLMVDGEDLIARTHARVRRERVSGDLADDGLVLVDAVPPEHSPQHEDRERDVESGAGEQHENALPRRPAGEGATELRGGHRALALIEHLDVAAQRNRGNDILRAVRPPHALQQRPAKSDREPEDLEAEPPRDPVMAELVHRDEQAHGYQEP